MRIAPSPTPTYGPTPATTAARTGQPGAPTPPPAPTPLPAPANGDPLAGTFDQALVVVHGMGNAYKSQILLEWAEPILERMDWLARDRVIGASDRHGVKIRESDLAGDVPMVIATVKYPGPKARRAAAEGRAFDDESDDVERRIAILEARWSESFVPMTRAQVFRWAVPFMWRTILRVIRLFWRTMVTVPAYTLRKHWKAGDERLLPKWLDFAIDIVRLLVGFAAAITVAAFLFVVALVLTPILPLLSPLLLIPWFKDAAQGVIDGIIESIGDVAAWKERPLRASAMRLVVRNALQKAKDLVGDGDVHLFAHSQGAAVATFTLIQELDPKAFNVRRLTTVGAAVVLLGRESWKGRPDKYSPVADWVAKNDAVEPNERVAWENHWAIWDPFSAGPIADSTTDARTRWRDAYFPAPNAVRGPEEHAVHNTSQPFLDHSMYFENTVQVVEPTVRHLLGPDFPKPAKVLGYIENVLAVRDKKSLGVNMLAAVVIAALVPGLPRVYAAFAWVVDLFATIIGTVIGFFPGGPTPEKAAEDARGSVSFLTEPDLTPWSWLVASALILAVLIWLNQVVSRWARRAREWDRCPVTPRAWLFLGSIPRAAYVFGAFACVWLAIMNWTAWPHTFWWVFGLTIGLIVVAVFVFIEPLFAPIPVMVPARQHESEASTPSLIAANAPMKLKTAIATRAYKDDLAARRRRLDPQGRRARAWARVFHRWSPEA